MHNSNRGGPVDTDGAAVITVDSLAKEYRVYDKPEGLLASVTGLFHRTSRLVEALRGVSLTVGRGEFVALLGPNGAGKTTFLKLLSGIITPSRGTARVLGHVPWERTDDFRRRFALVMGQRNQLWWDLPAAESFRLHKEIYRIEPARFDRTRDELVDLLGVRKLMLQPVRELSLGERMKLELVAALLHEPEVLFLDEPTIGLDVVAQHTIHGFLKAVQAERRVTVVLTTHYMKDVAALCERVVVITHGSILHDGNAVPTTDIEKTVHVAEVAVEVHGNDRLRTGRDHRLSQFGIDAPRVRENINENGRRSQMHNRSGGCNPIGVGEDYLVTRPDAERGQSHVQGTRAAGRGNRVLHTEMRLERLLEAADVFIAAIAPAVCHGIGGVTNL